MKRSSLFRSALRFFFASALFLPLLAQAVIQVEYYIDPVSGNDSNTGTSPGSAFRTLPRARSAVAVANGSVTGIPQSGDIFVHLMNGTHLLSSTLVLATSDSGMNGHNVIYDAYPGATPVISGGEAIVGGWYSVGNGIYARNSVSGSFRQLYVNGEPAIRARIPNLKDPANGGPYYTAVNYNAPFQVNTSDIGSWANSGTIEFVWIRHWLQIRNRVANYTNNGATSTLNFDTSQDGYPLNHSPQAVPTYYYFENSLALLDADGEWYHDTASQILYYKPRSGENMATAQVIVPRVTKLVSIAGTSSGSRARNITFRGLTFMHDNWTAPTTYGYYSAQGGFVHATSEGSLLLNEPPPFANFSPVSSMFSVVNADHISVERNVFTNGGSWGVMEFTGCESNSYKGNVFTKLASGGIVIGNTSTAINWPHLPTGTGYLDTITNNVVDGVSREYRDAPGIMALRSKNMTISNNVVRNVPYTGISLGMQYNDSGQQDSHDNILSRNRLSYCMQLLGDGGGIYNLGALTGTISRNYISRFWPSAYSGGFPHGYSNAALYLDNGSAYIPLQYNVAHNVGLLTFAWNPPNHDNTASNNSFMSVGAERYLPDGFSSWTNNISYANSVFPRGTVDSAVDIIDRAGLETGWADIDGNAAPMAQWGFNSELYAMGFDMTLNGHDVTVYGTPPWQPRSQRRKYFTFAKWH